MAHRATIVDMPDLKLMVVRAEEFPGGLKTAWDRLESKLSSLKGRKFYAASRYQGSQMVYFAGVVPYGSRWMGAGILPQSIRAASAYPPGNEQGLRPCRAEDHLRNPTASTEIANPYVLVISGEA
jgi:hypothetical protein